jgi:hypothetical protein
MEAVCDELTEPSRRQGDSVGRGDGDNIEAGFFRLAVDEVPEARRIGDGPGSAHQKSRSP